MPDIPTKALPWEAPAETPAPEAASSVLADRVATDSAAHQFALLKGRIHRRLLERLNLANLEKTDRETVVDAIRRVVHELLSTEKAPLNFEEREALVSQILDEIFGLGPLEPLMKDPEVSDVLVNTWKQVYIERHGKLEQTEIQFQDDRHLLQVIDRLGSP